MNEHQPNEFEIGKIYSVDIRKLKSNPYQPRKLFDKTELKALADDIDKNGLLQNITFTCDNGELFIISGERRVRAYNSIGKLAIDGKYIEGDLRTLALMENILRSDLTAVELAESVDALQKQKKCSNDEIAKIIGKKKSTTSEILKIAKLPEEIREDARMKPEMTRELLLKIARQKNAEVQQEMYNKLRKRLEEAPKTAEKSDAKPSVAKTSGNRFVTAHVSRINKLTEDLQASNKNMFEKNKKELTDEDKQRLTDALTIMSDVIGAIVQQIANIDNAELNTIKLEQ